MVSGGYDWVDVMALTKIDVTETTAADLTANAVLVAHAEILHHQLESAQISPNVSVDFQDAGAKQGTK